MLSGQAEPGHSSRLDGLSAVMDFEGSGVRGHGRFRIDESGRTPSVIWIPEQTSGPTPSSQDNSRAEDTFRALGGASNPILDAAEPRVLGEKAEVYTSRIKFLKNEAVHDGYVLNLPSEIDFWQFVRSSPDVRQGNLVLMDNGNLRAIWKDEHGSRLGLQFLGGRMVQYVIFKWRNHGQPISRVTGRDSLEGLARQIDAFELRSLLSE